MDTNKLIIYNGRKVDSTTILLLHVFLGWSYGSLGKMGLQILFYITCFGCGVWWLVRIFTLSNDVKQYNRQIASQLGFSSEEMLSLGLF